MTKQKRGFWNFMFSLIPGAGEMYMGFKKQGISIMAIFWAVVALTAVTGMGMFLCVLPIIWFYSFFNVHNLKSLSEEEFYSIEDSFVFRFEYKEGWIGRYRNIIAASMILIGCFILWDTLMSVLYRIMPSFLEPIVYEIGRIVPRAVTALIIIYLGIFMVRGKKKELGYNEDA